MAKKRKPPPSEPCPCGEGVIIEPWPCCEECRVEHFCWPLPSEVLAAGTKGVVVSWGKVQYAMAGKRCTPVEVNIAVDPQRHPGQVFFAWRPIKRRSKAGEKNPWRPLGSHVEATYRDLPASVDTGAYHWWSQTLAGAIEDSVDLDPNGL